MTDIIEKIADKILLSFFKDKTIQKFTDIYLELLVNIPSTEEFKAIREELCAIYNRGFNRIHESISKKQVSNAYIDNYYDMVLLMRDKIKINTPALCDFMETTYNDVDLDAEQISQDQSKLNKDYLKNLSKSGEPLNYYTMFDEKTGASKKVSLDI